ncbi:putative monovalent cation/H+ antiporter subunit A [soil metagenome]
MLRTHWASRAATVMTVLAFSTAIWSWRRPGDSIDREWAPTWGLRLHFQADGLANLYALLATGVGLAVVLYAAHYIPIHLQHQHRSEREIVRFYAFMLLFMGAMVGLVLAQDLLLIFLFWDLTAIASYFLIGYDQEVGNARISALMALLVTGISAIGFLVGSLLLESAYGTFQLPELVAIVEPGNRLTIAAGVMMFAALAKSAQVPMHFWLPRAMAAPTPVSAYLHSAAMVAAGVFLIGRIYPLIEPSQTLLGMLTLIGFASILTGGILALTRDNLKQLLAYSTISQYGYVVLMFGIGGASGVAAASFYVIAHGLAKSALFLTAGTVTEATGATELSGVGGLWRQMPLLAVAAGASAAGLAALPLTMGWFKDELFFKAAYHESRWIQAAAIVAAGLTFAYMGRFWLGIFIGKPQGPVKPVSPLLVAPIVVLGAATILGGVWPDPFTRLAGSAATATHLAPIDIHAGYAMSAETIMALIAFALGTLIVATTRSWSPATAKIAALGARIGPERAYSLTLYSLNQISDKIHWIEVRDLRSRVTTVLFPAALLVGATLLSFDVAEVYDQGQFQLRDVPTALLLLVVAIAAFAAAVPRDHYSMTLALSGVGFALAVVYSLFHAPNVALVAVLIETLFSLLLFGFLALLPRDVDHAVVVPADDPGAPKPASHHTRDMVMAGVAGLFAFVVAWGVLSRPAALESVIEQHIVLTPSAHGQNILSVILADFRGLDTMGEITVIGIAFLGMATHLRRRLR